MIRSEIRDSTIRQLHDKVQSGNYSKFLRKVTLRRVRGFTDEPVTFDFPVTAIVGPNGGGKTTILGAAGMAYKSVSPQQFFAKSGSFDQTMQNWSIEHEIIDRTINTREPIRRTATFANLRWRRDAPDRRVLVFGVARTVPANERAEMRRCASTSFDVPSGHIEELAESVRRAVGRILGKDISGFRRIRVDKDGKVTLLSGRTASGETYSEFHFGAGESSVIRMVLGIEAAEEQALVLIEEIENGLHPVATVRMVEYLIETAERKKIQAIFTTHSNDALERLPSQAIWVATQDRVFQGKLDIHSLRAITGQIEAQLAIFVEDPFAKIWVEAMLRQHGGIALDHVEVHQMEGDGTAVRIHLNHTQDPAASTPSICIIDGDSRQIESEEKEIYRLPGQMPEDHVYDGILEAFGEWGGKLTVALLQPYDHTERVSQVLHEIRTTNRDPHVLFGQVGERLGLIPEATVKAAFTNIWAQAYSAEVQTVISKFLNKLPMEKGVTNSQ